MDKIKVAAVSYLNTRPLLYGMAQHPVREQIELTEDYPASIAAMLLDGTVDMGLVPVAILPLLPGYQLISDYCIGCDGAVASVCIFSDLPLEEITDIYLDYQSRSSVMLARVLLKEYWKSNARLHAAKDESYLQQIGGTTAGLVIGDRAFGQRLRSRYIYDLGAAWKDHTGLPFVFATWVSNKILPADFLSAFNEATGAGLQHLPEIAALNPNKEYDILEYFEKNISYTLDEAKRKGLALFLEKLATV